MRQRGLRPSGSAGQIVFVTFVIVVVQAVGGIILARSLGPADRGALAALILWASIAADLAAFGTPSGVSYWAASGWPRTGIAFLKKALPLMVVVSAIGYAAIVAASGWFGLLPWAGVVVMGVWAVGQIIHLPVVRFQQGIGEMSRFNGLRVIAEIGPTVGYGFLALLGVLTVTSGGASITLFMLVASLVGVVLIRRRNRPDHVGDTEASGSNRFWSYSGRSWLSVLATRGNRTVDLLVLTFLAASVADVGMYAVAISAALVIAVVGGSLGLDLFPRVASLNETSDARPILVRFISVNAAFSLAAAVGFFVLADWLVPFVYGQSFSGAVAPARVLVFGAVAVSVSRVAGQGLAGLGRPGQVALAETVGAVVTLVGVLYAVNGSLSMVAAAATTGYVVTMVLMLTLTWTAARRTSV